MSRGHSSSWEKGKTERRIEACGTHVVLDQWERPAPVDAQAKYQDKSFYDKAKCHPDLSVQEWHTQDLTQEVPAGKGFGLTVIQYEREEQLGGPWAHTSPTALWAHDSRLALLTVLTYFFHQSLTPLQMREDRPLLTAPALKPSSTSQGMMNCSLSSKETHNLLLFSS